MKISIIGYMGIGKTFIGKKISRILNYKFYDLDKYIENKYKNNLNKIFKFYGEYIFRKIEHKYLIKILKKKINIILSLGGGTPCYNNNIKILNKKSLTVYLSGNVNFLYNRLIIKKNKRPIISHYNNFFLKKFIIKHINKRKFFYNKSLIKVKIKNNKYKKIINKILFKINKYVKL
ncbi:MAG: shikimate kinase [Candidatus Shikimatogenerans sp. Ttur]|uniref:Shikimate kinase n=1 Tax=Candidatus Shikimatogenerans sp. Ttur TaxID=3158569 RepID=A0AAU7ZXR1_9FLAO